jgi:hypothetical protein
LIICLLLLAWFSPVFKKDFVWAAIVVAVALVLFNVGVHSEAKRVVAQEAVVNTTVDNAVKRSTTPSVRKSKDPWDRKNY